MWTPPNKVQVPIEVDFCSGVFDRQKPLDKRDLIILKQELENNHIDKGTEEWFIETKLKLFCVNHDGFDYGKVKPYEFELTRKSSGARVAYISVQRIREKEVDRTYPERKLPDSIGKFLEEDKEDENDFEFDF